MADTDELQRLVVSLEANTAQLDRAVQQSNSLLAQQLKQMQSATHSFETNWKRSTDSIASSWNGLKATLAATLSLGALEHFASSISDQTEEIKKQSAALGISTDTYQAWSLSAARAGVGQDTLNTAIDVFSKNLGEAQLKQTAFGRDAQILGVNLKGTVEQAFYKYIDGLTRVGNQAQRAALVQLAFGRGSVEMLSMIQQGSSALKAQGEEFRRNGEIIDQSAIKKIDELQTKWGDLKAELTAQIGAPVLSGMADEFSKFTDLVKDPQFQNGLKTAGAELADMVASIMKMAPHIGAIAAIGGGAYVGGRIAGVPGAVAGGLAGAAYAGKPDIEGVDNSHLGQLELRAQQLQRETSTWTGKPFYEVIFGNSEQTKRKLAELSKVEAEIKKIKSAAATTAPHAPAAKAAPIGNLDLSGVNNDPSAYAKAIQSIRDRIAALRDQTAAQAASTEAEEKDKAAQTLLSAAEEDAAKRGGQVTAAQKAQIDDLASTYARLAAARAYAGDLQVEDERIAKLSVEGARASMTARQVAELESQQTQLADFHKRFGTNVFPSQNEQQDINNRASEAGDAAASGGMASGFEDARKKSDTITDQISALGKFGAAADEAQMRQELFNKAIESGATIDDALIAHIDATAASYGRLSESYREAALQQENGVQLNDQLRSGLENLGTTALTNFHNMKSALHDFLLEMAQTVVQLGVMQPLITSLFGQQGSVGQGALGGSMGWLTNAIFGGASQPGIFGASLDAGNGITGVNVTPSVYGNYSGAAGGGIIAFLSSMFSNMFAGGTDNAPGGLSWVGEHGPELLKLPGGSQVIPSNTSLAALTRAPQAMASQNVTNVIQQLHFHAEGAVLTNDILTQANNMAKQAATGAYGASIKQMRDEFPTNLSNTLRDKG